MKGIVSMKNRVLMMTMMMAKQTVIAASAVRFLLIYWMELKNIIACNSDLEDCYLE